MTVTLVIAVVGIVILGAIGFLAKRGRTVDVAEWTVGGRNFGGVTTWFLQAGEIFTTFTFLAVAGLACIGDVCDPLHPAGLHQPAGVASWQAARLPDPGGLLHRARAGPGAGGLGARGRRRPPRPDRGAHPAVNAVVTLTPERALAASA
ncbi:MAG: hypothetical protein ACRDRN_21850, partial [Sciscionella sp.]